MKIIISIAALIAAAYCQPVSQVNHQNASQLNYTQASVPIGWNVAPIGVSGSFKVNVGNGSGNFVTFTQGFGTFSFETYVSDGTPMTGNNAKRLANGDTLHLNLSRLWFTFPVFHGSMSVSRYGALATSFPYDTTAPFDFTVQSVVTDPTHFFGYRLTAAIHAVR